MESRIEEEVRAKRLPPGSFMVLREAALAGVVEWSDVSMLTGYEERAARMVTSAPVKRGMLVTGNHRAPLKLGFPADVVERWLPKLYPTDARRRP